MTVGSAVLVSVEPTVTSLNSVKPPIRPAPHSPAPRLLPPPAGLTGESVRRERSVGVLASLACWPSSPASTTLLSPRVSVYVKMTYTGGMDTKTERWSIRVTPTEDTIVRRVLDNAGMSLNEYVVSRAVTAAINDLADRRVFTLSAEAWDELHEILDRPVTAKPRIAALLAEPSVLESE